MYKTYDFQNFKIIRFFGIEIYNTIITLNYVVEIK